MLSKQELYQEMCEILILYENYLCSMSDPSLTYEEVEHLGSLANDRLQQYRENMVRRNRKNYSITLEGYPAHVQLSRRYLALPFVTRRTILTNLGLFDVTDLGGDHDIDKVCFKRAKERGILWRLWEELQKVHKLRSDHDHNPYMGR